MCLLWRMVARCPSRTPFAEVDPASCGGQTPPLRRIVHTYPLWKELLHMRHFARLLSVAALLVLAAQSRAADTYKVDPVHSATVFRIQHANLGYVWGRINDPGGTFALDAADPTKSVFSLELQVANVDTHNDKRDAHLKSPDFFNAKQYPTITFKSKSAKAGASANM